MLIKMPKLIIFVYTSALLLLLTFEFCLASKNRNRTRPISRNKCIWTRCSVKPPRCPFPLITRMAAPCGKPRLRMRTRIQCCRNSTGTSTTTPMTTTPPEGAGGGCQKVDIMEYPHQVALVRETSPEGANNIHFCSGTVYSENFVITSGNYTSCVRNDDVSMSPTNVRIQAGDTNLNTFEGSEQVILVEQIIIHEGFQPESKENDIALLKLITPLILVEDNGSSSKWIRPLPLPRSNFDATTSGFASAAGWPVTQLFNDDRSGDPSLHAVTVPIYPGRTCGNCRLCVASDAFHENCKSDIGSALVCKHSGTKIACGILSVSSSSAASPNVYLDISCYVDWITENVKMNSFVNLFNFLLFANSTQIIVDQY